MDFLSLILPIFLLTLLANLVEKQENDLFHTTFDWLLLILNLPVLALGISFLFLPPDQLDSFMVLALPETAVRSYGIALISVALWGALMSFRPVRQLLAKLMPLRADSPVHAVALLLSGYVVGSTFITLIEVGGLDGLAETTITAGLTDLTIQQFAFVVIALLGVGVIVRRDSDEVQTRLALEPIEGAMVGRAMAWAFVLLLVQMASIGLWLLVDEAGFNQVNSATENVFSSFDTLWEVFALAVVTGLGEEILFRGALQPVLGLPFTALVFTIAHTQYGFTPATLSIFILAVILGYLRQRYNTTQTVLVHFFFNFVVGLMALIPAEEGLTIIWGLF